jgi:stalled ribosome rescue protein Dom34
VGVGDDVELSMDGGWPREDEQLLREATRASGRARAMIIVVESDEVVLFEITNHGMRDISQFTLRGGGKREAKPTKVRDAFLKQAAEKSALVLGDELPIVICGPGMTRDQFARLLREAGCAQRTLNVATSIGGRSAANEVLAKQLADEFLGESAIAKQVSVIEEALARIATNGAVAYGPDRLTAAQELGAIETLVIVADMLRDAEANISGISWSTFSAGVTEGGGELVQASTDHDSGKQLVGMGGALALLRWKMDG